MIDFIKTQRNYIIALAVLFVFVSLSETTYSLFLKSDSTDDFTYNTGLLDLQFVEDKPLTLQDVFPMNDSAAEKLEPYNLTIKNTGSLTYYFSLKMISSETENAIDSRYIKVKVNDNLPQNLSYMDNIIISNVIIYPGEEITFKINIWLDINTPNNELGKTFSAKISTIGTSIYKTLDDSGANHPNMYDEMIPVYYDNDNKTWKIADKSNMDETNKWYNYNESMWANAIKLKSSDKKIYDIKRNNDLKIDNINYNNGNIVIDEEYLDINLSNYNYNNLSNIFRIKFNDLNKDLIYIISNGNISYYYDNTNKKFIFKSGNATVSSSNYTIEKNQWYILGYTYDTNKVNFYIDGKNIGSSNINGTISSSSSFKIGTNDTFKEISKITLGNILTYNRILTESEISKNYKTSMQIINDGLLSGYNEFIPMTLKDYYKSRTSGFEINMDDVSEFYVWIPRYKYRIWNITGEANIDSYEAIKNGIEISFENNTTSTGAIYCNNTDCYNNTEKTIEATKIDNNKYYTHPSFSSTSEELTGFWVSKYEVSLDDNSNIESKANNNTWRNNYLSDYYEKIKKISSDNDYHVIKNTEWGAIAYLAYSKYGICKNNSCGTIDNNKTYISGNNEKDSTTGNIYGVYDMAGGATEYTMGNISKDNSLNLNNSYFKNVPIGTDDYDLYNINKFILGDATKEVSNIEINNEYNWIIRENGIFNYSTSNDIKSDNISTRIVTK